MPLDAGQGGAVEPAAPAENKLQLAEAGEAEGLGADPEVPSWPLN